LLEASGMNAQGHLPIEQFMTPNPLCIDRHDLLSTATARMRARGLRHLPVLDTGKLVGLVSQRDIALAVALPSEDPTAEQVEDAMTKKVYVVAPDRPVEEVAAKMVESRYGCAVVARDEKVVGIFTTTDALRALVGIVEARR
jgi:acetoin utilization protein AcuB